MLFDKFKKVFIALATVESDKSSTLAAMFLVNKRRDMVWSDHSLFLWIS